MGMTDRERFRYDLQGFLVIPGFLTAEEVARLNEAIDANFDKAVAHHKGSFSSALEGAEPRYLLAGMLEWEKPWCDPFRDLLVHPKLPPYMNEMIGTGWRLDQQPFAFLADKGAEGLQFHGPGRVQIGEGFFYDHSGDRMRSGMLVVEYILSDHNEGDGGFAVFPGSHKLNVRCPQDILDWESDRDLPHQPVAKAGDVVIFNEACIHGTLPWTASHQRRALLYRYSPKYMTLGGGLATYTLPAWTDELTPIQRSIFSPPTILNTSYIDDAGVLQSTSASEYG